MSPDLLIDISQLCHDRFGWGWRRSVWQFKTAITYKEQLTAAQTQNVKEQTAYSDPVTFQKCEYQPSVSPEKTAGVVGPGGSANKACS